MTNVLLNINGSAYGLDATYNAVRLAASLAKREGVTADVFLMGDGVENTVRSGATADEDNSCPLCKERMSSAIASRMAVSAWMDALRKSGFGLAAPSR